MLYDWPRIAVEMPDAGSCPRGLASERAAAGQIVLGERMRRRRRRRIIPYLSECRNLCRYDGRASLPI